MRTRDPQLNANWGTICTPLEMIAADGKRRKIQSANTEGLLRIIQSIPSPKAEPFKRRGELVRGARLEESELRVRRHVVGEGLRLILHGINGFAEQLLQFVLIHVHYPLQNVIAKYLSIIQ